MNTLFCEANLTCSARKWADYQLFKKAWELIIKKEHLTEEGLIKIVSIKSKMNGNGLPDKLKIAFPNLIIIDRPSRSTANIELLKLKLEDSKSWLAGFIEAEGCFFIHLRKSAVYSIGFQISLMFQISQDTLDKNLLMDIVKLLDCGKYREVLRDGKFKVESLKDIYEKIIPYLDHYTLMGVKHENYKDFKKVAELIKEKAHLTPLGFEKIKKIKLGMNKGRGVEKYD